MAEGRDPVIVILGVLTGVAALAMITVGTYSLVRGRILARDPAAWKTPGDFGWFAVTMGLSLLLTSITIIGGRLGLGSLRWGLPIAALVFAVAAFYRIVRLVRRS